MEVSPVTSSLRTESPSSAVATHSTEKVQMLCPIVGLRKDVAMPQKKFADHHFSDPPSIVNRAAQFLHAGDYEMMMNILEVLDKHLVLSKEIEMAYKFGQGLANYKKYQCKNIF